MAQDSSQNTPEDSSSEDYASDITVTPEEKQALYSASMEYSQFALKQGFKAGVTALSVITVPSLMIWGAIKDLPGIWGVLLAAVIGGAFLLTTLIVVMLTSKMSPQIMFAVIAGSWLIKVVLLFVVLSYLSNQDFYDTTAFMVTLFLVVIAMVSLEVYALMKAPQSYLVESLTQPDGISINANPIAEATEEITEKTSDTPTKNN